MKTNMLKSMLLGLFAVTALTMSAGLHDDETTNTDNQVYMEDFSIKPGQTKWVTIYLNNKEGDTGSWQHFMIPSEGLTILQATLPTDMSRYPSFQYEDEDPETGDPITVTEYEHSLAWNFDEETGEFKIVTMNLSGNEMYGTSGPIARIQVKASADFTGGTIHTTLFKGADFAIPTVNIYVIVEPDIDDVLAIVPTTLDKVVAEGQNDQLFFIDNVLHNMATVDETKSIFVTDGNDNWMRLEAADDNVYTAMKGMKAFRTGMLSGTLQEADKNQYMTVTKAPTAQNNQQTPAISDWNLAQSDPDDPQYKFAPKVNEVFNLIGYYFDQNKVMRGYSSGLGQSASIDFSWCADEEPANGAYCKMTNCIAQLKEAWEPESSGAPRKVKASDELSFQNYLIYPLEISADNIMTGVESLNGNKAIASVKYVNVAGQVSDTPFDGMNMVITSYVDGTQVTTKVIK